MPTLNVPRKFTLRFDDGREVPLNAGRILVSDEIAAHPFVKRMLVDDKPVEVGDGTQEAVPAASAGPPRAAAGPLSDTTRRGAKPEDPDKT